MDLRVLEYFLAVVESGNVSKAAQKTTLDTTDANKTITAVRRNLWHTFVYSWE